MGSRRTSKIRAGGFLLALAGGCSSPKDTDEAGGGTMSGVTGGATSSTEGADSTSGLVCMPAPGCAGVELDDPIVSGGWAMGGNGQSLTLFLSTPATACGDQDPGACTECGIYESIVVELPPDAQAPGIYTESDVDLSCSSTVSDCNGNGEGEDGPNMRYTVEIVSIDEGCIVGEIVDTLACSVGNGPFAVARCG